MHTFGFSRLLTLLAVLTLALSGCTGYRVGPIAPKAMEGVKTIAVPTFHNKTLLPRLEVLGASSVIRILHRDGTYKVVGEEVADAVLEGTITEIDRRGARSVRGNVYASREYELIVTIEYEVTRRTTGERLERGTVRGVTSFFVSGNDVNQDERQAIPLALEDAANQLVSRISEGW